MLGISRRKRKKDDEDEELDDEEEIKPKVKKKPRKKKEPKKPWGKKERLLVASVISFTIFSSFLLLILSKDWKAPKINLPGLSFQKDEPLVLGKSDPEETSLDQAPSSAFGGASSSAYDEMKKLLNERLSSTKGTYGIDIIEISTDKNYGINKNEKFESASFFKLPLMIAVYSEKEKGHIDLSSTHTLQDADKQGGSGVLVSLPAGTAISYKDLISYMGKESDNTAFNILGNQIGWNHVDEIINKVGMLNTSFSTSITTPYDMGLLFQKLIGGELVSEASKQEILDLLTNPDPEGLITKGVGDQIKVAHKYASEIGTINDGGIIFARSPYILIVMTKGQENDDAKLVIPDLSRIVYNSMR